MLNPEQQRHLERIQKAICESVTSYDVTKGAICVTTPFLDWKGAPVEIFITSEGRITDGGDTIGQIKALRAKEEFDSWPFLLDFFSKYCIDSDGIRMILSKDSDENCYLRFIQGISRLPGFFEPKPITTLSDRFPETVKNIIIEIVEKKHPKDTPKKTVEFTTSLIKPREVILKRGYSVISDLSPIRESRMIEIISHAKATKSDRAQHVRAKVFNPVLWKLENPKVEAFSILHDIADYPPDSRQLLRHETEVIELRKETGKDKFIEILISR